MKNQREAVVIKTSAISIITNIALVIFKAIVGILANSIAIISDAINNLSDVLSSVITIIGTKIAAKEPDKKHPFGHGRIEYITSLIVSGIIIYAGIATLIESIKKIIDPEPANFGVITILVVVAGIIVKFVLGFYVRKKGKEINSDALIASGIDATNDAVISISVLISSIIYIVFKLNLEAYVGILISAVIIKAGLELIKESIDNIVGVRVENELLRKIEKEVIKDERIKGAYDLVLNNYGPDKYLGSIHIELSDDLTVAEVDKISRNITKNIMEKYGVLLHTIGVYSTNSHNSYVIEMKEEIKKILSKYDGILQMHGFYIDEKEKRISFDIVIDFKIKDRKILYNKIYEEVKNKYKDYKIDIIVDADISVE